MKSDESLFRLQADKLHQPLPPLKNVYYFPEFAAIEKLSKQMKTNSLNKILYFYQKIFTNEFFKFSAGELKAHLKDRLDESKISLKDKFILYNAPIKNSSEQMFLQMINSLLTTTPQHSTSGLLEAFSMNWFTIFTYLSSNMMEILRTEVHYFHQT